METKKTLVLGASEKPERYSYKAITKLEENGIPVVAIGNKEGMVGHTKINSSTTDIKNIHTVTLYLSPKNQAQYYDLILSIKPQRIIFNPGTENEQLEQLALKNNIEPQRACTLVLLSTGQY